MREFSYNSTDFCKTCSHNQKVWPVFLLLKVAAYNFCSINRTAIYKTSCLPEQCQGEMFETYLPLFLQIYLVLLEREMTQCSFN